MFFIENKKAFEQNDPFTSEFCYFGYLTVICWFCMVRFSQIYI